jgi:hypothetical protein
MNTAIVIISLYSLGQIIFIREFVIYCIYKSHTIVLVKHEFTFDDSNIFLKILIQVEFVTKEKMQD